jgi:hypothetical protein
VVLKRLAQQLKHPFLSVSRFGIFPNSRLSKINLAAFTIIFASIGIYFLLSSHAASGSNKTSDLNGDGVVNITDLSILLSNWQSSNATSDLNNDGIVSIFDLSILLSNYGMSVTACNDLFWPAPALSSPTTINVPSSGGGYYQLNNQVDYNIVLPAGTRTGSIQIDGGNHTMTNGPDSTPAMLYFTDNGINGPAVSGRVIHVAHLSINLTGGIERDGIAYGPAPSVIGQIEDVRILGTHGAGSQTHADIIQPYSSMQQVRIDRLTGDSDYQGLTFLSTDATISSVALRRVNLTLNPSSSDTYTQIIYLVGRDNTTSPISFNQVYVNNTRAGQTAQDAVYPDGSASPPTAFSNNQISFTGWPNLSGVVIGGNPPGGNFSCQ